MTTMKNNRRFRIDRTWQFRSSVFIVTASTLAAPSVALAGSTCTGDVTRDGYVDSRDLGITLGQWGTSGDPFNSADFNNDGIVDASDLGQLLASWGPCCTAAPSVIDYDGVSLSLSDIALPIEVHATGSLFATSGGDDLTTVNPNTGVDAPLDFWLGKTALGKLSMANGGIEVRVTEGRVVRIVELVNTLTDEVIMVDGAPVSFDLAVEQMKLEIGLPPDAWSTTTKAFVASIAMSQHGGWFCSMQSDGVAAPSAKCLKKVKIASVVLAGCHRPCRLLHYLCTLQRWRDCIDLWRRAHSVLDPVPIVQLRNDRILDCRLRPSETTLLSSWRRQTPPTSTRDRPSWSSLRAGVEEFSHAHSPHSRSNFGRSLSVSVSKFRTSREMSATHDGDLRAIAPKFGGARRSIDALWRG